jgi:hypothetical protein
MVGEFQGALPEDRCFEFRMAEWGDVIRGKIGPVVGDPDVHQRFPA